MRRLLICFTLLLLPLIGLADNHNHNTHEYMLKNGLKLIVRVNKRAPVVLSSIWYKVGGGYEHDGITGISHVLEHMMFKGTKKYGPGELNKIISDNGGTQNAMTSADFTMYYQELAANKLPISFELEADRMRGLVLEKQSLAKELKVVMEERRMRVDDNPQGITWERFQAAAHVNNPYHHPVVGWMTDIKHLTLQDVRQWYDQWYGPNNAVVVVVGDVDPIKVKELAEKYFGPVPAIKVPTLKPRTEVESLGQREVTIHKPAKLPWLLMGYNTPSLVTAKHRWQAYALMVMAYVLSGNSSSRLEQDMVRNNPIAASADAGYTLFSLHSNVFMFTATPIKGHTVAQLQAAIAKQVHRLKTTLVSAQELQRVKAQLLAQTVYRKDSLMRQAYMLGWPEMVGLSWRAGDGYIKHLEAVTPEQIQAVAKQYLQPQRLTVAILKPTKIGAAS